VADLTSPAQRIRDLARSGDREAAIELLTQSISALVAQSVVSVTLTSDAYSLNSVSGVAELADGQTRFFKFHVEDGESDNVSEYYRAQVLADVGLPVDLPLAVSHVPGEQLVLYAVRTDERMVDVCLEIERSDGANATLPVDLVDARRALDRQVGHVLVQTLGEAPTQNGEGAALHQLFTHRMRDADGTFPGGRYRDWYIANDHWSEVKNRQWRINGVDYELTLDQLAQRAWQQLTPHAMAEEPVVTAHGDDHHGNVWVERDLDQAVTLSFFDPAFAGDDIPALLALVKPTFHNVFAHPMWLYHPDDVRDFSVVDDGTVISVTSAPMSPLRREIFDSIVEQAWLPLISTLADRGVLASNWREIVRSALFLCPFLVTNLLSPTRSQEVGLMGLGQAVMMGSEPVNGSDALTDALDRMQEVADR